MTMRASRPKGRRDPDASNLALPASLGEAVRERMVTYRTPSAQVPKRSRVGPSLWVLVCTVQSASPALYGFV